MIVITLSNCPNNLRGDITLWLQEISTNVFVGNVSARVRDNLWDRIIEHIKNGSATMSYTTNNEQRYTFRTHNVAQTVIDKDGLDLVYVPNPTKSSTKNHYTGFSKAARHRKAALASRNKSNQITIKDYCIIDIETTGLNPALNEITQISALKVVQGKIKKEFNRYCKIKGDIPDKLIRLNGISTEFLNQNGQDVKDALLAFVDFCGTLPVYGYRVDFDMDFLQVNLQKYLGRKFTNKATDIYKICKTEIRNVANYKLTTVARKLGFEIDKAHDALNDCKMLYYIVGYLKDQLIKKTGLPD